MKNKNSLLIKDLKYPKELIHGKIPLSQSLLKTLMKCDYAFLMAINKYEGHQTQENFFFGDCCHQILDEVHATCHMPPSKEYIREIYNSHVDKKDKEDLYWLHESKRYYYEVLISSTMFQYFQYMSDDFDEQFSSLEEVFVERFYKRFRLTGKKDGVRFIRIEGKLKKALLEHKTKVFIKENDIEELLKFDFQSLLYIKAEDIEYENEETLDGVIYNVIRKSKMYKKANEKLEDFGKRLEEEIDKRPEYFFYRWYQKYTSKDLRKFTEEAKMWLDHVYDLVVGNVKPKRNFASCNNGFTCEFLNACSSGSVDCLKKRKHVSPELK